MARTAAGKKSQDVSKKTRPLNAKETNKQTKKSSPDGAVVVQKRAAKSASLKKLNPKASRKKPTAIIKPGVNKNGRSRMSNFNTTLRKNIADNKTLPTKKLAVKETKTKSTKESKVSQQSKKSKESRECKKKSISVVKKPNIKIEKGKSLKAKRPEKPSGSSTKISTTTTSTVFTLISTSTSSDASSQVSIAMYQQQQSNQKSVKAPETPPKQQQKSKMTENDLKHIMDSIERVVSNSPEWIEKPGVKQMRSRSSSGDTRPAKPAKTNNKKSAPKTKQRRPASPVGRPLRKRLASLNALAKVHCLYESDARYPSKKRTSDSETSDDETSSSESSSRSSSRQRVVKESPLAKKPVKKAPKKQIRKRQSMEVSAVDLSELVTPKRMASLNAAAILAASSQHWSDRPRKKNQIETESESETEKKKTDIDDDDLPLSLVKSKKQSIKKSEITSSIVTTSSVRMIVQQQVEGRSKTTTKSTFHESSSVQAGVNSTKSFQKHVTCLKVSPTEHDPPGFLEENEQESSVTQKAIGSGAYSPLGALYNMRPPNTGAGATDAERRRHESDGGSPDAGAPEPSNAVPATQSSPTPSSRGVHVKERDKIWPPSADRLVASAMPSVNFGGVPFMLSNHHPVQSVESYAGTARFAPSFSLYRPPIDIPYASLYPPTYQAGPHFAAPSYYRGFALLPPPGPGFVPVALADSYSAYALAAPPPIAGTASGDLSYYLHRYPATLAPPPCGSITRYLPTPCTLVNGDWRGESNRSITELSSSSSSAIMHDDRSLLPLAGAEAATTSSAAANSSSATSAGPKLEAGNAGHPVPTRTFCPLDAIAMPVGSALAPGSAPPNTFASRCLPGNCSCSGQSTIHCPKNVLAGPLTGEGKRSEPNSPSQSVIPHPSLQGVMLQSPTSGAGSPQVPCLPPELLCHAIGPLETAADQAAPVLGIERNNNDERKRKLVASPVSSRLRHRLCSANCGSDCGKDCCRYNDAETEKQPIQTPNGKSQKQDDADKPKKAKTRKMRSSDAIVQSEKKSKTLNKYSRSGKDGRKVDSPDLGECVPSVESLKLKGDAKRCKSRSPIGQLMSTSPSPQHPRWSNGWSWMGPNFLSRVHMTNDDTPVVRRCYRAMKHKQGDIVQTRDCILLKSGPKAKDLPFVAKVSALWENAEDGEMMMSLLWYYRPEHTEGGRKPCDLEDEIFASRHRDVCSVACIEDKCHVLTFNEYCRYRKQSRMVEEGFTSPAPGLVPPLGGGGSNDYPRRMRLPAACTPPDRVFLCRKVYDFRQKRILKNPT